MTEKIYETYSPEETHALGKRLGAEAKPATSIRWWEIWASERQSSHRELRKDLASRSPVSSPTFTIVQVYEEGRMPFYHFDVYRIGDIEEMDEIGYEDYFYGDGLCMIEWANLIEEILPERRSEVTIEKDLEMGFDYRRITIREHQEDRK